MNWQTYIMRSGVLLAVILMTAAGCGSDDPSDSNNQSETEPNQSETEPNQQDPDAATGILEVTVGGLDSLEGLSPDPQVVISGEGISEDVTNSGTTTRELAVGEYEVDARDVEDGPATFEGATESVTITEDNTTSLTIDYSVVPGALTVGFDEHPEPSEFAADVQGPGFSESISEETTWDDLTPGTYTVDFSSYSTGDIIWDASLDGEEVLLQSGSNEEILTDYEMREGTAEINLSVPDGVTVDYSIVDDAGDVAESFSNTGSGLESIDLAPGDYEVIADTVTDEWDNPFSFNGTGETFSITSAETRTLNVSTQRPSTVTGSDDDGDEYGSLREVLSRVNTGTEVQFDSDVSTIELDDTVVIDQPIHLMGHDDGYVGITHSSDSDGGSLLDIDYQGSPDDVIHVEGIEFFDAESLNGAGIDASSLNEATLQIFDCKFSDLVALNQGGAIRVSVSGGSVHIVGSEFVANTSDSSGGALYFTHSSGESGELTIEDSYFEGNASGNRGGAVAALRGDVTVEDSHFDSNEAENHGGAISLGENSAASLQSSEFLTNSSDSDGGAIHSIGDLSADEILVESNEADGDGGAIMLVDSTGSITQSIFYGNSASGVGGAIRLQEVGDGQSDPYSLRTLLIEQNQAQRGSALYAGGNSVTRTYLTNSTIVDNETSEPSAPIEWSENANGVMQFSTISGAYQCSTSFTGCLNVSPGVAFREDSGLTWMRAMVIDSQFDSLDIEDRITPIYSQGYNILGGDLEGIGEFQSATGDQIDVDVELTWSESYSDSTGIASLNRVARLDVDDPGYRNIPSDVCQEIQTTSVTSAGDERVLATDQRGMARPSGAFCSSGAWEPDSRFEDFVGVDLGDSPGSGSFTGQDDRNWDYDDAYSDADDDRIILTQEGSSMSSTDIESLLSGADGVESMAIVYEANGPSADGDRQVRVRADGTVLGTSDSFDSGEGVLVIDDFQDFEDGDNFQLEIENNAPGADGAIAIKQVVWR